MKDTIQDVTGNWDSMFKLWNNVLGDDWIDGIGDKIKEATGVDITSHEKNKKWVQATMKKIGLDFDVSGNCYITYGMIAHITNYRENRKAYIFEKVNCHFCKSQLSPHLQCKNC